MKKMYLCIYIFIIIVLSFLINAIRTLIQILYIRVFAW